MDAINIANLKKYYGRHLGVEDVSFSVKEGEIFGFVGPNGAGKSTTIRVLMNLIFPTSGKAFICGCDAVKESHRIKKFTGYVPADVRLYEDMTVKELIKTNNGFYEGSFDTETQRLCELFELDVTKKFYELSTGNKKKAAIVCALATKPRVLILDEPTSGLDPMIQKRLFSELKNQSSKGVSILLSSHNLSEVQEYCDRVAFIKQGRILTITDLKDIGQPQKIVTIWGGQGISHDGLKQIREDGGMKVYRYEGDSSVLLRLLQQAKPDDFTIENEKLEERFMNLYEEEGLK